MKNFKQAQALKGVTFAFFALLTACKQEYAIKKIEVPQFASTPSGVVPTDASPTPTPSSTPSPTPSPTATPVPTPTPSPTPNPTPSPTPSNVGSASQTFNLATGATKKIDMLFVVDNSASMSDEQDKLAAGFQRIADTFFRRSDLDICVMIITSDRFLGRTNGSYSRERSVGCTKPAGSSSWSQSQIDSYITGMITDFTNKVRVGTGGQSRELLGKSLVTFLYNQDTWTSYGTASAAGALTPHSFFRSDAISNVSFITDENNYYFTSGISEASNDIPVLTGTQIPGSSGLDNRIGIKNHLDTFFNRINPSQSLNYSVTTLLKLPSSAGYAVNLGPLPELVLRGSARSNIDGDAASYAAVYDEVTAALIDRANGFNIQHAPLAPLSSNVHARIVRQNGSVFQLDYGTDFTVDGQSVQLVESVLNSAQVGDQLVVDYNYLLP